MQILPLALLLAILPQASPAQSSPIQQQTAATPAPANTPPPPPLTSAVLQPAIESLRGMLVLVRVEKWKTAPPIRDNASSNLDSIQRDLDTTLPPLVKTADAAPTSVTQLLPVFRNVNALYDVLLRVSAAAEVSAPRAQADSLKLAVTALDQSRRNLGDTIQTNAAAQEQQITDLGTQLRAARAAAIPPPPPPAPAPSTTKPKPKQKKKPS